MFIELRSRSLFVRGISFVLLAATCLLSAPGLAKENEKAKGKVKPSIMILATGGTIAGAQAGSSAYGYKAASFDVQDLIKAVPKIDEIAKLNGEQVANIGSQDMNDEVWLKLAKRANELLRQRDVEGVVITHGTDTMEETAYFLNLVLKSDKPVVLVGSMRPATAISADGPGNLYNAVATAADPGARKRGVLVAINDEIHQARNVTKTDTTNVETFESPNRGPVGYVNSGTVRWLERMDKKHTAQSEFSVEKAQALPQVDIVYAYSNMNVEGINALVASGAKGLVIAGVGDGNMTQQAIDLLGKKAAEGVVVVRSTRLPKGLVLRNNEVDDDKLGFVASGELNPPKSRVLLQLALMKTQDPTRVQTLFEEY